MNYCQLTAFVTGIANYISARLSDDDVNLLGAVFSQLGDTLETIAVQRSICGTNNSGASGVDAASR